MKNIFGYKNGTTLQLPLKAGYDLKKNTHRIRLIIIDKKQYEAETTDQRRSGLSLTCFLIRSNTVVYH